MVKIAPSLLAADFLRLEKEIRLIEKSGSEILHLDVMDGHFVPNLTFGFPIIKQIREFTNLKIDVHLMVTNPEIYIDNLSKIGVDYISIHQETVFHLHRLISKIKENNCKAGVALNPATPVETIFPIINDLDFVLLMSVNPGFGGQTFLSLVYEKIRILKLKRKELCIEIDGGVTDLNAKKLIAAGAEILVSGSYIFSGNDYSEKVGSLR